MRINELSKELGITNKELIAFLEEKGITGKTHMSNVSESEESMVRDRYSKRAGTAASNGQVAENKKNEPQEDKVKKDEAPKSAASDKKEEAKGSISSDKKDETPKSADQDKKEEAPRKKKLTAVFRPQNAQQPRPARPKPNTNKPTGRVIAVAKPEEPKKEIEPKAEVIPEVKTEQTKAEAQSAPVEKKPENEVAVAPAVQTPSKEPDKIVLPKSLGNVYDEMNKQAAAKKAEASTNQPRFTAVRSDRRPTNDRRMPARNNNFQNKNQGSFQGKNRPTQGGGFNKDQNQGRARTQGSSFGQRNGAAARSTGSDMDGSLFKKPTNNRAANKNNYKNKPVDKKHRTEDGPNTNKGKVSRHPFIMPVKQKEDKVEDDIKEIIIPDTLTIKELASKLKLQPSTIVKKLFLKGEIVTLNTELTYEHAEEIALEYDVLCTREEKVDVIAELLKEGEEDEKDMTSRPPVVCVMGHVDHGKTSLLDAIRKTDVTEHEAGGITQHIGAYQVKINDRLITFLDTPGHEAFTAMRMRGAQATDIAVLVVAADDGVMPQTIEAINHAKAAGVEIIVAINKIDKPSANVDRVKQELSEYELIPEDWGGDTTFCEVSAHTKEGIPNLLEMILLTADVKELKANPNRKARGLVIEAELDKGKGPVATVLVQKGTLHVGDFIAAGACSGKVRAMMNDKGQRVEKALPSTPVEILGLDNVPNAGEICLAMDNDKEAKNFAATFISEGKNKLIEDTKAKLSLDNLFDQMKASDIKELPIIVKADVQGSVEAVKQSLGKLSNEEVQVRVIHSGVGAINESDVSLAAASNAIIIGFDVRPDTTAKATAEREKVDIRLYKVIYQAIEDIEAAMNGMLAPIYEEKVLGHAEVRQLFKASGVGTIAGAYILDGKFERGCKARITRDGEQIFDGALASLKRFKDDVKEVTAGYECGLVFDKFNDLQELDQIEAYGMVEVPRGERNEKKQQ